MPANMLQNIKLTAKNTIIYSIGNVALKASGIILIPLYGKYLSIDEFGIYALFEVLYQFFQVATSLGTKSALPRWYWLKEMEGKQKNVFFTVYVINILLTLILLGIVLIVLLKFSENIFNADVSDKILLLFVIGSFFRIIVDFPLLLLRVQHKAISHSIYQIIILIITVISTVYFIAFKELKLDGIFLALLISNGLGTLILIPCILKNTSFKLELAIAKEMIQFGIPIYLSRLVTLVLVLSDRYLLNIFDSHEKVGQYSLAYKISNLLQMVFVTSFMSAYTNVFFQNAEDKNSGRFFSKSLTYFVLIIIFASVGLIFFSKEIAVILSNGAAAYWEAYKIVPLLVLGVTFGGINSILLLPFAKEKLTKQMSIISITIALINFGLNLVLIPAYSANGAALSTAFAQLVSVVWLLIIIYRKKLVAYEIAKIMKCFILGIIFIFIYYQINDFHLVYRLIIKVILIISYFMILYFWNFYEDIELIRLKQAWVKWSSKIPGFRSKIN